MRSAFDASLVFANFASLKRSIDSPAERGGFALHRQLISRVMEGVRNKQVLHQLGAGLMALAERAQAFRQTNELEHVSLLLMGLGLAPEHEAAGHYYHAVCIKGFGPGDVDSLKQSTHLLAQLADSPTPYRANAMFSLGSTFMQTGDNQLALSLYREAARLLARTGRYDPYTAIGIQKMIALISSKDGNHRGALALIENLFRLAYKTRFSHPHIYHNYLNSLAVELCEVGRLEEAWNASEIVIASPFAHAFPEWLETREEIAVKVRRASNTTVAIGRKISLVRSPNPARRARPADSVKARKPLRTAKLLRLPVPGPNESLAIQPSPESEQSARVLDYVAWIQKRMLYNVDNAPQVKYTQEEMDKMTRSEKLVRLMNLISTDLTEDQLNRILSSVEEIATGDQEQS